MKRYIECAARDQIALLPESLEDYVGVENPVRVIDVFVDELDLAHLGFERAAPASTGRPGYHPATLLKLYIYGYLNRLQSSRRLEREAQRNLELIWLLGRLTPDFKTVADFRKDNGDAIRGVCRQFVTMCTRLSMVGYNVQTAFDLKHHMIVAHEVINVGHDRTQLASMARLAREAIDSTTLSAFADRGYFKSEEIMQCKQDGITPLVPKPLTSNNKADGLFDKRDFVYIETDDEYQCPAGERAIHRFTTFEAGLTIHKYWSSACPKCAMKPQCTACIR